MPRIPIIMPQLGESIAEATVVSFKANPGDAVAADQEIIEVETNKAVMSVTTPCAGKVGEFTAAIQESYAVGAVLGFLEVSAADAAKFDKPAAPEPASDSSHFKVDADASSGTIEESKQPKRRVAQVEPTIKGLPVPANAKGATYLSPRMKARMQELGLQAADLAGVAGSGAGKRVTIEDLEKYLSGLENNVVRPASSMRVAVADAMRRSWSRPIATIGIAVSLQELLAHRKGAKVKSGPALYTLRALAIALGENRAPAARLVGERLVHPTSIDIGFAVEAEDGVLVPVLRNADQTSLAELTQRYNELVELARQRRISPESTVGSIATVTNFGTFGIDWATPIPLPEQTLLLGLGAGKIAPHWDAAKKEFDPRTEADLTLSFDHRVLDGGAAGRLLKRIADLLAEPGQL